MPEQAESWLWDLGYEDTDEEAEDRAEEGAMIPPSLTKMMNFYRGGGKIKVAMIHFYPVDTKTHQNYRNKGPARTLSSYSKTATSHHQDHLGKPVAPIRPSDGRDGVHQSPSFKSDRAIQRADEQSARRDSGQLLGARAAPAALEFNQIRASEVDRGMQCLPCQPESTEVTEAEKLDIQDRLRLIIIHNSNNTINT